MNALTQAACIAAIALAAAGGTWLLKGPPARTLRCEPALLKPDEICLESISDETVVVWVDARSRADWEASGVPGSVLWNLDPAEDMQAFEMQVAMKIAENPRVVVYCGDENCGVSRQVAERIRALDLGAEVSVLHGGWRALSEAGRVKGSSPAP
jgi:rhodanese-related sulfurtransferase